MAYELRSVDTSDMMAAYYCMWAETRAASPLAPLNGLSTSEWLRETLNPQGPPENRYFGVVFDPRGDVAGLLHLTLGTWPGLVSTERVVYVADLWLSRRIAAASRTALRRELNAAIQRFRSHHNATATWAHAITPAQRRLWQKWGFHAGTMVIRFEV